MKLPTRPRGLSSLDGDTMTPMIDVVFLLLVFFICASVGGTADRLLPADLHGQSGPVIEQPKADEPDWQHPLITIRLELSPTGISVRLNQQPLNGLPELTNRLERLAAADPASRIILDVHDELAAQLFVTVYDLCQRLKFEDISIAVKAP